MKIDDKYAPQQIEPKWYDYWMRHDTTRKPGSEIPGVPASEIKATV